MSTEQSKRGQTMASDSQQYKDGVAVLTPEELERYLDLCDVCDEERSDHDASLQSDPDNVSGYFPPRLPDDVREGIDAMFSTQTIRALLHEVRQSRQGWIPVSEKLPDELGIYMVYAPFPVVDGDPRIDIYRYDPDAKGRNPNWGWKEVIAWRPLPAAPDKE